MDLKQLQYFVRVAKPGGFTRAALALDIAQPALSRQVRLLDVELRQTLLVRNGRGAVPTEAGRALLAHSRGILHQVQRAKEELAQARGALAGRVAVGLPTGVAAQPTSRGDQAWQPPPFSPKFQMATRLQGDSFRWLPTKHIWWVQRVLVLVLVLLCWLTHRGF